MSAVVSGDGGLGPGARLANYRIDRMAGRGGMGVVYVATHDQLQRRVALKVLAPELAQDADFRERFVRESQIAASIDHPNVIPLYDAGEADGLLYIAMRYVDGLDLSAIIAQQQRLEPPHVARIVMAVANGLDAAHARGLVHRDVKPANVLVDDLGGPREHVYLTDFGLTKTTDGERSLTKTGMFVGTLDYIAPEQLQGEPTDARTDVYALGGVLYQALTGQVPYPRDSEPAKLWAHMSEPPPRPSAVVPGLEVFDAIVTRAMAKSAADRFGSAGDLGRALEAVLDGSAVAVSGPPARSAAPAARPHAPAQQPLAPPPPQSAGGIPAPWSVTPRRLRRRRRDRRTAMVTSTEPAKRIRLRRDFRYSDAPLRKGDPIPLLGNGKLISALVQKLDHSQSGSMLIAGFPGVGKSTIVEQTLDELASARDGAGTLPIKLNVARARTTRDLLVELVRRVHERLIDDDLLDRLDPGVRRHIEMAYERTLATLSETRSTGSEGGGGIAVGGPSVLGFGPKFEASAKRSMSHSRQAAFLPFDEADLEHYLVRVVDLLGVARSTTDTRNGLGRIFSRAPEPPWHGRVVVVLDELDKLTASPGGAESVRDLLNGLKNLLTSSNILFLFVAGVDLLDEAAEDHHRGNSVFDAVFGWRVYVPCVWATEDALLDQLLLEPDVRASSEVESLRDHLAFWGRGVPRLLLRELESFVTYDDEGPYIALSDEGLARIKFYAGLERVMRSFVEPDVASGAPAVEIDEWRLGAYYALEWIVHHRITFTVADIVRLSEKARLNPALSLTEDEVSDLLEHLEQHGVVHRVDPPAAERTVIGDSPDVHAREYQVSETVEHDLTRFDRLEAAGVGALTPADDVPALADLSSDLFRGAVGERLGGDRYEILDELDRLGTGRVYRARDLRSNDEVVVKVFDLTSLQQSDEMRARFERERAIALSLRHPHIVKTYDAFTEPDGRLAIVMQLVSGRSLRAVIEDGPMPVDDAVAVAGRLLDALDYVGRKGLARLDLRPSNVLVDDRLSPTLVNVGLAKHVQPASGEFETRIGVVVGTPAYAAPEQLRGEAVDIRADLFALGVILYELIAGEPARDRDSLPTVMHAALEEKIDPSGLPVSAELRDVLSRATELDPDARFRDPREMQRAIEATPEAAA